MVGEVLIKTSGSLFNRRVTPHLWCISCTLYGPVLTLPLVPVIDQLYLLTNFHTPQGQTVVFYCCCPPEMLSSNILSPSGQTSYEADFFVFLLPVSKTKRKVKIKYQNILYLLVEASYSWYTISSYYGLYAELERPHFNGEIYSPFLGWKWYSSKICALA